MSIFKSQFDQAGPYRETYAGEARDPIWRSPTVIGSVIGGAAAVGAAAVPIVSGDDDAPAGHDASAGQDAPAGQQSPVGQEIPAGQEAPAGQEIPPGYEVAARSGSQGAWGEGWDTGWDAPAGAGGTMAAPEGDASWMDRGDYTDAGVGGDGDFFYFIDGDTSATIE
jgi:hypothetical protein